MSVWCNRKKINRLVQYSLSLGLLGLINCQAVSAQVYLETRLKKLIKTHMNLRTIITPGWLPAGFQFKELNLGWSSSEQSQSRGPAKHYTINSSFSLNYVNPNRSMSESLSLSMSHNSGSKGVNPQEKITCPQSSKGFIVNNPSFQHNKILACVSLSGNYDTRTNAPLYHAYLKSNITIFNASGYVYQIQDFLNFAQALKMETVI